MTLTPEQTMWKELLADFRDPDPGMSIPRHCAIIFVLLIMVIFPIFAILFAIILRSKRTEQNPYTIRFSLAALLVILWTMFLYGFFGKGTYYK